MDRDPNEVPDDSRINMQKATKDESSVSGSGASVEVQKLFSSNFLENISNLN